MDVTVAWLAFPLVLLALCLGCGLLVERLTGAPIPGALIPVVGLALIIVIAQFLTMFDSTAELATPIVVGLAIIGLVISRFWHRRFVPWAVGAALAVFLVYAAPIVLSGEATFAGYIKLDDTATWLALTDRVMEHGRSLSGLAPSSYEATLAFNLGAGYPVGAFLPFGIGGRLVGMDLAWLIQPYMAFLAALGALAIWQLAGSLFRSLWLRAAVAFVAAQSTILVGYYLWGGIKEVIGATLIAATAGLCAGAIQGRFSFRTLIPVSLTSAALVGALSGGGAIWLAPLLLVALLLARRALGLATALQRAALFAVITVALCIPVLVDGGLLPPTSSPLTSATAQGNLYGALDPLQVFGIWPAGDFRFDPVDPWLVYPLIALAAAAAVAGLYVGWRARAWPLLLYLAAAVIGGGVIYALGSPWIDGKTLAIASPAILLAASAGAGAVFVGGQRVVGGAVLVALGLGVLWSNALAYRDVSLAPRAQLAELETIAGLIGHRGPTLMTEYQPYGVRHFLRDADPEGASELRRREVSLVVGGGAGCPSIASRSAPGEPCTLRKSMTADVDRFKPSAILIYRTLVLRRTPGGSRPPSPYRLVYQGRYYDVWQRPAGSTGLVIDHLGLGTENDPASIPRCPAVQRLAREVGPDGTLAAVRRDPVVTVPLARTQHPAAWDSPHEVVPSTPGTLTAGVRVPRSGDYTIYLGGSVRPEVDVSADGNPVGSVRQDLNNAGEYVPLAAANLPRGTHTISLTFHGADLHPGSGGAADPIGPLALSEQDAADTKISYFRSSQAGQLCGRPWDWIEAVQGASVP